MKLNQESEFFVRQQTNLKVRRIVIEASITLGIVQLILILLIYSEITLWYEWLLTLIPMLILAGIIVYQKKFVDYKKDFLYRYMESFEHPQKIISSLLKELTEEHPIIGKTHFSHNWIVRKKYGRIEYFVNYNHITHIHFGLYSHTVNLIPVQHTYTMYVESGNITLPFEIGNFKNNCERATDLINSNGKKQYEVGKII